MLMISAQGDANTVEAALSRGAQKFLTRRLDFQRLKQNVIQVSYSPELNPDEVANADLKQTVTKLAPARTKPQLVKATVRHLRSVQKQPERVRNYFQHTPVRYAA